MRADKPICAASLERHHGALFNLPPGSLRPEFKDQVRASLIVSATESEEAVERLRRVHVAIRLYLSFCRYKRSLCDVDMNWMSPHWNSLPHERVSDADAAVRLRRALLGPPSHTRSRLIGAGILPTGWGFLDNLIGAEGIDS